MRELKKGDRCEARVMATDDLKPKLCNVLHMEGKPPRQLIPCKRDRKTLFLCTEHQANLSGISVARRTRAKSVAPEQISLVTCASVADQEAIISSPTLTVMDFDYGLPTMPD
jgi:hypothetical protein